jgi:UDP-N-acetylmuramoyl-tripeptide--D-alanyl-D-alanine ligase
MAELGPGAPGFHREIGGEARRLGIDLVVAIGGRLAAEYGADALAPTPEAVVPLLERHLEPGDAVLVKGSRAAGLEVVADALTGVPV